MKEKKNNLIQIPLSKNRFRHSLALAGLVLLLGVGLFGSAGRAQAAGNGCTGTDANGTPTPTGCVMDGTCTVTIKALAGNSIPGFPSYAVRTTDQTACTAEAARTQATPLPGIGSTATGVWVPATLAESQGAIAAGQKSPFETAIQAESCGIIIQGTIAGCAKQFFYFVIYLPSAVLLSVAAQFFNALVNIALSSALFSASSAFLSNAWGVVRDLSNLFFILILLYIAIKIILDMGGHDAKKMIAKVIVIALLINFSMFFTQVIIDSSNILALIFYNKLDVTYKDANGQTAVRPYGGTAGGATGAGEKDIAGSMYSGFDVTSKLDGNFWKSTQGKEAFIPAGTAIGVILVAAAIMLFAAYAFFISGIAFVARVIELFVLIIFSPFAFMSSTVPLFSGVEYIGWDSWVKRLLKVAFMAPIFMFFMYLIFLLLNAKLFGSLITTKNDWVQTILGVIVPGVMILVLLLKATEYAKKGSGVIGEKLMAGAKMVGGLALGAATGGTAFLASNSAGRIARNIANNDDLKVKAAAGDKGAQRKLTLANSFANKSFDIRQTGLGKLAAKQSGMDFNAGLGAVGLGTENLKGGRKERDKEAVEKHEEKVKSYELSKSVAIKQDERARQYDEHKKQATRDAENSGQKFDDDIFKDEYEKGNLVGYGRDNRKVETGSIKNAKGVNADRRKAYAYSLEYPNAKIDKNGDITKDENGNVIREKIRKGFGSSFVSGMAGMATNPAGLALAAATAGLAIPLGGLAAAIKDLAKTQAQQRIPLFTEHKEIIAGVRKGPDEYKEWLKKVKKDIDEGKHPTSAPTGPAPATPLPATPPSSTTIHPPGPTH